MISKNSLLKMLFAFGAGGFVGLFLYNRLASAPQAGNVRLRRQKLPQSYIAALVPLAAALNLVGGYIVSITRVPIFLDMMGTAVTAFTIGPWWAAITGIITNIGESIIISPIYLPFAVVNVAGGLLWGYSARWGMAKSFVRLLILGIAVGILSTLMAVPIITFVFGGATGVPNDVITAALLASGKSLLSSVFISNAIANLSDKIISTFIAVAIIAALPATLKSSIELAQYRGMKLVAYTLIGIIIGLIIMIAIMYGVFH
jgi:energy-coupling factor transport system substrate-specific component